MSEVILEQYPIKAWGGKQRVLAEINQRIGELRKQRYKCEEFPSELDEDGEVYEARTLRAVRYPKKPEVMKPQAS